jgi:hypothetical protein
MVSEERLQRRGDKVPCLGTPAFDSHLQRLSGIHRVLSPRYLVGE